MSDTTDTTEVKTIAEVEAIVNGSGAWDGTDPVEFSNDGEAWTEAWAPNSEHTTPTFARVSVYRKDVTRPTRKTIRWDEHVPREDLFWLGKWMQSPSRHFGRTVRMVAYRETFRDLLGTIRLEDEGQLDTRPESAPAAEPAPAPRDFRAEFAAAADVATLDQIVSEARKARVFTPNAEGTSLETAWRDRRRELSGPFATPSTPETPTVERPVPRDRMPATRTSTKRKRARRKGGRR